MTDLQLTMLQIPLLWHDPAGNRAAVTRLIADAAAGSDLIVLPETFSTGFTMEAAAVAEPPDGPTIRWLLETAAAHEVSLCGSMIVTEAGAHYNRLVWATPDGNLHTYDKRHLFRLGGEHDRYTPGHERIIVELNGWRICPLVCYDLRFPVWSRNRNDYDLLLYVANWPVARMAAWNTLLPARAVENQAYVAGVNRTGVDGNGIECGGGSMICDYFGARIAEAGNEQATLRATLSMADLQRFRERYPFWKDADAFDLSPAPAPK